MKKIQTHHILILILAMSLTALAFWHDYKYDSPSMPYTRADYFFEIIVGGIAYTALFYGIFFGIWRGLKSLFVR